MKNKKNLYLGGVLLHLAISLLSLNEVILGEANILNYLILLFSSVAFIGSIILFVKEKKSV